jgi:hypothetical protein
VFIVIGAPCAFVVPISSDDIEVGGLCWADGPELTLVIGMYPADKLKGSLAVVTYQFFRRYFLLMPGCVKSGDDSIRPFINNQLISIV